MLAIFTKPSNVFLFFTLFFVYKKPLQTRARNKHLTTFRASHDPTSEATHQMDPRRNKRVVCTFGKHVMFFLPCRQPRNNIVLLREAHLADTLALIFTIQFHS